MVHLHQPVLQNFITLFTHMSTLPNYLLKKHYQTLSKIGNSALNLVQTNCLISWFDPGSCMPNWLQGKARTSRPENKKLHKDSRKVWLRKPLLLNWNENLKVVFKEKQQSIKLNLSHFWIYSSEIYKFSYNETTPVLQISKG